MITPNVPSRTAVWSLLKFVLIAFGWSWAFWLPATLAERNFIALPMPAGLLEMIGGFGPLIAAVVLTARAQGRTGLQSLFQQAVQWRVAPVWYAVVLIGPFLYQLAAMGLHVLLGDQPPDFAALLAAIPGVLVNFVVVFFLIGVAEEVGWRGYLLPRQQAQFSALVASLIVGIVWAVWHLPLFFNPGTSYSQTPFGIWLLFLLPYTILHTWLYNSSRGTLLLSIALHAMVNVSGALWQAVPDVGPVARTVPGVVAHLYRMDAAVLWGLAVVVIVTTGERNLARQPRQMARDEHDAVSKRMRSPNGYDGERQTMVYK